MKKLILSLSLAVALCSSVFAEYAVVSVGPGLNTVRNIGVAKVEQINVTGSTEATGTVILQTVSSDGATTNAYKTVTCSGGAVTYHETNTVFVSAGDTLLRTGTSTDGTCKIIVAQ